MSRRRTHTIGSVLAALLAITRSGQAVLADSGAGGSSAVAVPATAVSRYAAASSYSSPVPYVAGNKEIVVSLSRQLLTAYQGNAIFLQTLVTTGGPNTPTPLGVYHVLAKRSAFVMHSPWPVDDWRWYPDSYVHYALLFEWSGYFVHDASWRGNFGPGSNALAGTPGGDFTGTHGCVNLPLGIETSLYFWAPIGTPVIVQP